MGRTIAKKEREVQSMKKNDSEIMKLLSNCSGYPWTDQRLMKQASADPSLSREARMFARAYVATKGFQSSSGVVMPIMEQAEKKAE